MVDIRFSRDDATEHLNQWGMLPHDSRAEDYTPAAMDAARAWWLGLLESVTNEINDTDWDALSTSGATARAQEIPCEMVDRACTYVASGGLALRLVDMADLYRRYDARDNEVEIRLTSPLLDVRGDEGMYRHAEEEYEEYEERRARAVAKHREEMKDRLRLDRFTGIYLESAAVQVAAAWCQAERERWDEANEEEEEEE